MNMKRRLNSNGGDDFSILLGDEIICEILSKLPVKSIMRCKLVCKSWKSIIEQDDYFHNLHLTQSKTHPSLIISILKFYPKKLMDVFWMENLFKDGAAVHRLTTPCLESCVPMLLRSVNGLLCLVERDNIYAVVRVFNPTTRETTPFIQTTMSMGEEGKEQGVRVGQKPQFGFGCDVQGKEHKVICIWEIQKASAMHQPLTERVCEVMTVGDNTWRMIDAVPPYNVQGSPLNINGLIFFLNAGPLDWEARDCNALVAFDVASETFSVVIIPYNVLDKPLNHLVIRFVELLEVDGCLAILHSRISDDVKVKLWIMVNTSNWIEETISMPPCNWNSIYRPTFRPIPGTDQIIIKPSSYCYTSSKSDILFYYDRKKKTSTKVTFTGIHSLRPDEFPQDCSIDIFRESLLSVQKSSSSNNNNNNNNNNNKSKLKEN